MAIGIVKNNTSLALTEEVTEGTYVAESSGADFVEVKEAIEFNLSRESLTRDVLTNTVEGVKSRLGTKEATGSIPVELKAAATASEGDAPQGLDLLFKSLLGGRRQRASTTTSDTSHTTSVLNMDASSVLDFALNDIIKIKEAGNHWLAAVTAINTGVGTEAITFFPTAPFTPTDNVVVSKVTQYYHSFADLKTLSATHYIAGEIREKVLGLRASSGTIGNWTTGQLPEVAFAMEGLDLTREDGAPLFTPTFEGSLPPILLEACAYIEGTNIAEEELDYNEFSLNIENELSKQPSACAASGFVGTRVTGLSVSASINPYMDDTLVTRFDDFLGNDDVKLFVSASNPTATAGETTQSVVVWMPQATITAIPTGDVDGIVTDALELKAHRDSGGDSIFIGFV